MNKVKDERKRSKIREDEIKTRHSDQRLYELTWVPNESRRENKNCSDSVDTVRSVSNTADKMLRERGEGGGKVKREV